MMNQVKTSRRHASLPAPAQAMLPYVRAALEELLVKFRKDPTYQVADSRTAELLVRQLGKQGLRLLPGQRSAMAEPTPLPAAEDSREPRRVSYTQRETHKFLKQALSQSWPETAFFVRSASGCTTVYYLTDNGGPAVDEVEELALGFEGVNPQGAEGWESVWHPRTGEDGHPELVSYGTDYVVIAAVTTHGRAGDRKDGLTHLKTVFPLTLRDQLLR